MRRAVLTGGVLLTIALAPAPRAQQTGTNVGGGSRPAAAVALAPTNHPVLPRDLSRLWFVPGDMDRIAARVASVNEFASAMRLAAREGYAKALPILSQASTQQGPLGEHAIYYAGLRSCSSDVRRRPVAFSGEFKNAGDRIPGRSGCARRGGMR